MTFQILFRGGINVIQYLSTYFAHQNLENTTDKVHIVSYMLLPYAVTTHFCLTIGCVFDLLKRTDSLESFGNSFGNRTTGVGCSFLIN